MLEYAFKGVSMLNILKNNKVRLIYMYLFVLIILVLVQVFFLDSIDWLSTIFMPAVVAFLALGFLPNPGKGKENNNQRK
jgi:purine-cytosine permease-like protein